jgi:membrane protease YdiL (CAAX protease family)
VAAVAYAMRRIDPGADLRDHLGALAALALALAALGVLALDGAVERLRRLAQGRRLRPAALAALFVCAYLPYWATAAGARPLPLLVVAAGVAVPATLAILLPVDRRRWVGDALVVLAVWLPAEFRWLAAAFPWPPRGLGTLLWTPIGLGLLLYLMTVVRRLDGVGFGARPRGGDLAAAAGAYAAFAAVGIPIGLLTGFLGYGPDWDGALAVTARVAMIFLFTGVPEETLFRGFIQGLLARFTGRPVLALTAASLLFGAAHLNNGPVPDWRYALLTALAGGAYGWVYHRTRTIAAAAVTHTLVDATWVLVFRG